MPYSLYPYNIYSKSPENSIFRELILLGIQIFGSTSTGLHNQIWWVESPTFFACGIGHWYFLLQRFRTKPLQQKKSWEKSWASNPYEILILWLWTIRTEKAAGFFRFSTWTVRFSWHQIVNKNSTEYETPSMDILEKLPMVNEL